MNLLTFPPVCLPSKGQIFEGMEGTVSGKEVAVVANLSISINLTFKAGD